MTRVTMTLFAAFLVLAPFGAARAGDWEIDTAHTTAQFTVRHMMVANVRGHFEKVTGIVQLDEQDPTRSKIDVTIDASTVNTRQPSRDGHLKSADFFDVAKTPNITFKSTKIERAPGGQYKATGDLTMRGVTRPVTLLVETFTPPMKNPAGAMVRGVSASGTLNRKEWGLNWNKAIEAGGVLVGDEVKLQIDAELIAKDAAQPAAAKK